MQIRLILSHSLAQKLEQRLSHSQLILIEQRQLQVRRDLVGALQGEIYVPKATCGKCHHPLTDLEILKGFRDNPRDYTTRCPKCDRRFLPRLYHTTASGGSDVAYYCPAQTLDRIQSLVDTPLEKFRGTHAGEYNSAIIHFGGLKQAFKKLGLTYKYEADLDWKSTVRDFIGKMPDTVIAELVGAKAKEIGKRGGKWGLRLIQGIMTLTMVRTRRWIINFCTPLLLRTRYRSGVFFVRIES